MILNRRVLSEASLGSGVGPALLSSALFSSATETAAGNFFNSVILCSNFLVDASLANVDAETVSASRNTPGEASQMSRWPTILSPSLSSHSPLLVSLLFDPEEAPA